MIVIEYFLESYRIVQTVAQCNYFSAYIRIHSEKKKSQVSGTEHLVTISRFTNICRSASVQRSYIRLYTKDLSISLHVKPVAKWTHRHVISLKTRKCTSSTIQNILLKYGTGNGLSLIPPKPGLYTMIFIAQ